MLLRPPFRYPKHWVITIALLFSAALSNAAGLSHPVSQEGSVTAKCYWADTGVRVEKGNRYKVQVGFPLKGYPNEVNDWRTYVADLRGWPQKNVRSIAGVLGIPFRRHYSHPWFALIATVDRKHSRRLTPISSSNLTTAIYEAPASGRLICYFNDVPFLYWNNRGTAQLLVTPIP